MCFLILDMLTLNKLLRTTGFEPLYLSYRQKFFSDFRGGKKNINGNIFVLKYHKYTSDHSKCWYWRALQCKFWFIQGNAEVIPINSY